MSILSNGGGESVQRRTVKSFCRICFHGCPIVVETRDGAVSAVSGDNANEVYRGYTCVKGRAQPVMLRHPERLLTSLKLDEDGSFQPIGIEQAMDEIAAKLTAIVARHGPRAIASYWGTMTSTNSRTTSVLHAFMNGIGSRMQFNPNTIDKPGKPIAKALHGSWMAPAQGFDRPEVAVVLGMNPLVSYQGAPFGNPGKWINEMIRQGMTLIVLDPRESDLARRATLHLQLRPGTDAAVLAAMIHVILAEDLYDHVFVGENVAGVDELRRNVARFDPRTVAALAGVEAEQLAFTARTFARASRGYAVAGTGPAMSGPGTLVEYLVLNLMSLCGRWLREGEVVRNPGTLLQSPAAIAQASPPWTAYGFGERLRVRGLAETAAGLPVAGLAEEMLLDGEGRVRCLLSCGGNPASAWPGHAQTVDALSSLDLLVQIDPWMSHTARLAHYVIAPTMPLETADVTLYSEMSLAPHLGTTDSWAQYTPAVADRPPGSELIEEWEFFFGLAQRMNVPLHVDKLVVYPITPFDLDTARRPTSDELIDRLVANGRVALTDVKSHPGGMSQSGQPVRVLPKEPGWTGRLDVANPVMMRDLAALRLASDASEEASADGQPVLRLVSRRTTQAYNSSFIDESTHRGRLYNPAFIHPLDMVELAVAAGETIEIVADRAAITAVAEPDASLRRGVISISHGYGGRSTDDVRQGGSNVNELTYVDADHDPYSGQPRMSNVPVRIRRVEASENGRA